MSRNVYRLCNTSHIQSKPANTKIIQTIAYWVGQLFAKPRLTMVCITPAPSQLQTPFTGNKAALVRQSTHATNATQQTQATDSVNNLELVHEAAHNRPNSNPTQSSTPGAGSSIAWASQKANMLFLKVYNGPIFQDKKVDHPTHAQAKSTALTSQISQSVKDPFCLPNQGLYPACLQILNAPPVAKKPVFISGKMSDIFAQLDQLAA